MSILGYKRKLFADGGVLRDSGGGGGGGSPAPTQTTVQNTNIPEYAQPYVENMLNAAQAQIYKPDMTGFNPYTPYSTNPTDYVAGFSPLQQQAQSAAANLQVPGSMGIAQGMTAAGTLGAMGAGRNYAAQATDPYAMQSYMNPYLNAALQPQLAEIGRQYDISGTQQMGNATRSGAFGGNREALMAAENQRNKNIAMNQAIGTGYNNAFQQAQQAQQFGANLGLQGIQAGLGGAGQLGNQGAAELAARQGILGTQAQQGAQQQNQQQNIINQAVQNYATAQQYPYLQLGMLNSMLRGLPMQQSSTQMYQAAPSTISQLGGLGMAGLGGAAMYNAATKTGASGGLGSDIAKFDNGGAVHMKSYSDEQLKRVQNNPRSKPLDKLYAAGIMDNHGYVRSNPEAAKLMAQQPQGMPPPQMASAGLENAPTGDVIPQQFAAGGIMAYAGEDDSEVKIPRTKEGKLDLENLLAERVAREMSRKDTATAAYKPLAEAQAADIKQQRAMLMPELFTRMGLGMMAAPSGEAGNEFNKLASSVGRSGLGAVSGMSSNLKDIHAGQKALSQGAIDAAKADQARQDALTGTIANIYGTQENKKLGLAQVNATKELQLKLQEQELFRKAANDFTTAVEKRFNHLITDSSKQFEFQGEAGRIKAQQQAYADVWSKLPPRSQMMLQAGSNYNPAGETAPVVPGNATMPGGSAAPASNVKTKEEIIADATELNKKAQSDPSLSKQDKADLQKRYELGIKQIQNDSNIPSQKAAGNKAMPVTPGGQLRWEPTANGGQGALVPIR
jgi:hypothetical protein